MTLLAIFLLIALIGTVVFVVSQIAVPLVNGTPLYPDFRKKSPVAERIEQADSVLEDVAEAKILHNRVQEIKRQTAEMEDEK